MSIGLGLLSSFGLSQNAYVTGNLKVKVEPNTLVYFGENLEMTSAVTADKVLENAGNIKIDGNFVNPSTTGANFLSTWDAGNVYGQVIINQSSTAQKLAMEKGKIDPSLFNWGQFALPFAYVDAQEAMQSLFGVNYSSNPERYFGSMMYWRNDDKPRWDQLTAADTNGQRRGLRPGEYVILNLANNDGNILPIMSDASTSKLAYKGTPTNAAYTMSFISDFYQTIGATWDDWKNKQNYYKEKYHTYMEDHLRDVNNDAANYAKFSYQFGNPYTSNIDLIDLPTSIPNLIGVFKFGNLDWSIDAGSSSTGGAAKKVTYDSGTGVWAGDAEALIARPFEPFVITLADENVSSFSFNDGMKTFSMASSGAGDVQSRAFSGVSFYQLGLQLFDNNDASTGNRVYVVATSNVSNGMSNHLESEYSDFKGRTGFYLAQEDAEGLPVAFSSRKMDINSINTDFENKPIPIFFNRAEGDNAVYHLKANLFFESIFNELAMEDGNYPDTNSFYFFDGAKDVMVPITTDFSYEISSAYNQENLFEVYWNVAGEDGELSLEDLNADATKIYNDKLNQTHKVRFNSKWTSADIKVYDVSGRSIKSFNNVKTQSDLDLNLYGRGVYIVRIKANTGEVYTQKIIK